MNIYNLQKEEIKKEKNINFYNLNLLKKTKYIPINEKEKNEQINLNNLIKETNLSIQIGNRFKFYIISNKIDYTGKDNRKYIKIISEDLTDNYLFEFLVYSSLSELRTYRFCGFSYEYHPLLWKGSDYVAVTFIHFDLQRFINQNIDKIKTDDTINCKYIKNYTYKNIEAIKYLDCEQAKFYTSLDKDEDVECRIREKENNVLNLINKICRQAKCFRLNSKDEIDNKLLFKNIYFEDEDKEFNEQVRAFNFSLLGFNYKEQIKNTKDPKKKQLINRFIILKIIDFINNKLNNNFDIINIEKLDVYKINEIVITSDLKAKYKEFYKYVVEQKNTSEKFDIYCSKYNVIYKRDKGINIEEKNEDYYIIDLIVPHESKINQFGLFNKFIMAGILNYKPLDYIIQSKGKIITDNTYRFIGHYLQYMWPLPLSKDLKNKIKIIKNQIDA
jgi:uncharacterized protein YdcH (DUF465 family)/ribosome-associated protein YbcJ (S4-like RNA binding protein)